MAIIHSTENVTEWLSWERPDMDTPYAVVCAPYGETISRDFSTEAEAEKFAAEMTALTGTYGTSWGEQPVNTEVSVIHYIVDAPAAESTPSTLAGLPDGTYIKGEKSTDITNAALTTGYVVATGPLQDMAQVAPGGMFGVWTDADGTVYRDIVEVWQSRAAATIQAERRGELAIWDVAAGEEILTSHGRAARGVSA